MTSLISVSLMIVSGYGGQTSGESRISIGLVGSSVVVAGFARANCSTRKPEMSFRGRSKKEADDVVVSGGVEVVVEVEVVVVAVEDIVEDVVVIVKVLELEMVEEVDSVAFRRGGSFYGQGVSRVGDKGKTK